MEVRLSLHATVASRRPSRFLIGVLVATVSCRTTSILSWRVLDSPRRTRRPLSMVLCKSGTSSLPWPVQCSLIYSVEERYLSSLMSACLLVSARTITATYYVKLIDGIDFILWTITTALFNELNITAAAKGKPYTQPDCIEHADGTSLSYSSIRFSFLSLLWYRIHTNACGIHSWDSSIQHTSQGFRHHGWFSSHTFWTFFWCRAI